MCDRELFRRDFECWDEFSSPSLSVFAGELTGRFRRPE